MGIGVIGWCISRFGLRTVLLALMIILIIVGVLIGGYLIYGALKKHQLQQLFNQLRPSFKRLLAQLKGSTLVARFRRTAHAAKVPWFILDGASGTGKTSLLRHAAVQFSRLGERSFKAQQPYDWWFSDQAVMIDTQGWSEDFDETEQAWSLSLNQLKRLGAASTLRGMIVTIRYQQLLQPDAFETHLMRIRKRVDELYQRTGLCLPIFLVLTQCDAMAGFKPFFMPLDAKARQQVWGVGLGGQADSSQQLSEGMDELYQRLTHRLFSQIHMTPDVADKLQCLQFLKTFHQLKCTLQTGLTGLFQETIYHEKIQLAGVYLTSAMKADSHEAGYFIHDFLKQRVFLESPAVYHTQRKIRQLQWMRRAKVWMLSGTVLVVLGGISSAYFVNSRLLTYGKELAVKGGSLRRHQADHAENFAYLDAVAQHVYELRHFKALHPWYHRLGLTRNASQLDLYEAILANSLNQTLYAPVKQALRKQLAQNHQAWSTADDQRRRALRGAYYNALKLYLMLNFPQYLDLEFATVEMKMKWQQLQTQANHKLQLASAASSAMIESYLEHLKALSESKRHRLADYPPELIDAARHDLLTPSGAMNWFASLENQWTQRLGRMTQDDFFENSGADLWRFSYELPKFYSKEAYQTQVKSSLIKLSHDNPGKDWIIHEPLAQLAKHSPQEIQHAYDEEQRNKLFHELNALYFNRYLTEWVKLIASTKTVSFSSYEDAGQQLRILYHPEGPFQQLFSSLQDNLSIESMLARADYEAIPEYLRARFFELQQFTQAPDHNPVLKQYLKQLTVLQQDIERLSIGGGLAQTSEQYVRRLLDGHKDETELSKTSLLVDELVNGLDGLSSRQALKMLLLSPAQETYRAVLYEMLRGYQYEWQETVLRPYREQLLSHFPFDRHGPDANLAEFSAFFKPESGRVANFIKRMLPLLDKKNGYYQSRVWLGVGLPVSHSFLKQLDELEKISLGLFASPSRDLSLHYAIYPIPTPGVREILFVSNGQSYPYRNGPQEWVPFIWPQQDHMDHESFVRITRTFQNAQSVREFQGPWGLFHLLQSADQITKTERGYRVKWLFKQAGDHKTVQILLAAKSQVDPFETLLFKPIRLSDHLT